MDEKKAAPSESLDLDTFENEVRQETLAGELGTLEILNKHLGLYLKVFNTLKGKVGPEDQLMRALLLLGSRSFNSLRCAFGHLETGYYSQAITLTRSAMEDWLALEDCRIHPCTLKALFSESERMPRFSVMADRLSDEKQAFWKDIDGRTGTYSLLSTISHPRYRALLFSTNPTTKLLRLGPDYNDEHFNLTSHYILMAISNHLHVLVEMAADHASHLRDDVEEVMGEGLEELKRQFEWAQERLAKKQTS